MRKQNKGQTISLNGGELVIEIDGQGNVIAEGERQLTARQLDGLAMLSGVSEQRAKLIDSTVDQTSGGWDVAHNNKNGDLEFGCQNVSAADILRVHKASLAARVKRK